MSLVRVRQHVNPLSQRYQGDLEPLDRQCLYAHPERPLYLDIGCARGKFLLELAQQQPEFNFLGLEIRQPLVAQANQFRDDLQLSNLHYMFANANTCLPALLPPACLQGAMIQFPDPWFKRRHQKRRVVQSSFVEHLATCLQPGGLLFLQSDVQAVARQMRARFLAHPGFGLQHPDQDWLPENPFPVATEREVVTLAAGLPVYRVLFRRLPAISADLSGFRGECPG